MAKHKHAKIGRPTKGEGPKLSNPEEVERLLVEGEVVPDEHGEAKRVWLTQRDVAARFGVAVSTIAAFAKDLAGLRATIAARLADTAAA